MIFLRNFLLTAGAVLFAFCAVILAHTTQYPCPGSTCGQVHFDVFSSPASAQLPNDCVSVSIQRFYPDQAGSEMYALTNNCGVNVNVDFATQGLPTQLVHLNVGQTRFTGWSGHVPAPYKFWYCPEPNFPSDPNLNPFDGPTYDAQQVVCRQG